MEMDLEAPYGVPRGHPIPLSFYNAPIPLQLAGTVAQSAEASARFAATRQSPTELTHSVDGSLYLYGGPTIGQPPNWMTLLEICGFNREDRANVPTFVPSPGRCKSATIKTWLDGPLHVSSGVRGICSMSGVAGKIPEFQFGLTGLYSDPSVESIPASNLDPAIAGRVCGINFYIDVEGFGTIIPVVKSYAVDFGGYMSIRNSAGSIIPTEVFHINGRNPLWDCVIEVNTSHDWATWYRDRRPIKLSMGLPTANRKTIRFQTNERTAVLGSIPQYAMDQGIRCWQLSFSLQTPDFITISHG